MLSILKVYLVVGVVFGLVLAWYRESWKYDPRGKELRFLLKIVTLAPAGATLVIAAILVIAVISLVAWVIGTIFLLICIVFPQIGRRWEGCQVVTCSKCDRKTLKAWVYGGYCDLCRPSYYP